MRKSKNTFQENFRLQRMICGIEREERCAGQFSMQRKAAWTNRRLSRVSKLLRSETFTLNDLAWI